MGLDDLLGNAKDALAGHEDQAKDALDKAGDFVKEKTDVPDDTVDTVVGKASDFLDQQKG